MSDFKHTPEQARSALVTALRSGDYKQAEGQLRRGDRFCCLGVACDLFAKLEETGHWDPEDEEIFRTADGGWGDALLPDTVRRWLNFRTVNGELFSDETSLAGMNDRGASFADLAKVIEQGQANA
ncbi:hypothetical protein [Inquilinus limosus]|uniref:Uncharacterized protein n=1 Tax=Inquilinus limosus MP06 TaxID=1398085 RepID=A0A0A0DE36_9PROT|nr:hypothetical protein [Inquilinus limosus]KGM36163.1 hypothetical protein P409_00515 [Inquilinus limosus MP06]